MVFESSSLVDALHCSARSFFGLISKTLFKKTNSSSGYSLIDASHSHAFSLRESRSNADIRWRLADFRSPPCAALTPAFRCSVNFSWSFCWFTLTLRGANPGAFGSTSNLILIRVFEGREFSERALEHRGAHC